MATDPQPLSSPGAPRGALPQRFVRSATANYLNTFVTLLLALLVTPILVRGLGKEAFGTWTLVTASVLYYSVLQFGLSRAVVKFVAEAHAAGDDTRARRVISTAFLALSLPAALLIIASPGLALLFPVIFDLPEQYEQAAMVLVVLSAVDFAFGMPADTFSGGLIALQRYDLLNVTTTATALAQAAAWAVIVAFDGGLVALGVATLMFSLVANVVRYVMVRRLLRGVHIGPRTFDRGLVKPLVRMSSWIALTDFVEIVTLRIDPLLVGVIVGVPEAGVYAVGQKLAAFVDRLSGPALAMFFPHAAALSADDDREGLRASLLAGTRLAMGITVPLAIVLSVLAEPAVRVWVGDGFDGAAAVVVFLSLTAVATALPRVGVYILRGLGDVAFAARVGVLQAIVSVVASIVLARAMGLEGVALGTLVGVAASQFLLILPYVCRRLEVPLHRLAGVLVRAQLLPAGLMLACCLALRSFADDGFLQLMATGVAAFVVYLPVYALTGLSAGERARIARLIAARLPSRAAG